jgi:hypothetical protein
LEQTERERDECNRQRAGRVEQTEREGLAKIHRDGGILLSFGL